MIQDIKIESLDYYGRGVAHVNSQVIFVENALPLEIVDIKIIKENKKYKEAVVINYKKKSLDRVESICPYFNICGGCKLQFYNYQNTLKFKLNKVKEQLDKNKIKYLNIDVIASTNYYNYRNKISLKIVNGLIGYYKENTHELIPINNCVIATSNINKVIKNYKLLNVQNGSCVIRENSNEEILIVINSKEKQNVLIEQLKNIVKLVGVVYNEETIYNANFFYERIDGYLFKVSYNSFFQVNRNVCKELFHLIDENIDENAKVLDLYSGVGTLSIVASKKAREVVSVEIVENAVMNAIKNASLNKRENIRCLLKDAKNAVTNLGKFDIIILDPPRSGLDQNTKKYIMNNKPKKIIYVSCDLSTLIRDLKDLGDYVIIEYKILDMFCYTYHVECVCILNLCKSL